jgi:LmbE family N-acetylglucosaminyl deacetylase
LPKFSKPYSVLAIGAHPDDLEFGCAGTLSRFVQKGNSVYLMILTDGKQGGVPPARRDEQIKAAETLGAKDLFWGDYPDTRLSFYDDVIVKIEEVIKKTAPSFVFVHSNKETHQDHRHANACTISASRNIPNVLFYEGPSSFDFEPNVYVDVQDCIDKKMELLKIHQTQVMRTNVIGRSIVDIAMATASFRGTHCNVPFAEAFISLRMMFLLPEDLA